VIQDIDVIEAVLRDLKTQNFLIFIPLVIFFFRRRIEFFPREVSYSKLNASTMGGQRKGSLKDRSELEFSYRRKELLNLALFDTQLGSKNKVERNDAEVDFCLRYFLLKKDHERRVNEIESRIEQSTCSAKRDFTTFFDDAERYNEQTCLSLFRFKMEEINRLVELLSLNEPRPNGEPFQFSLPNRATFTGKEGLLLLLAYLNSGKPFITLLEEGFTFGALPAGSQLVN